MENARAGRIDLEFGFHVNKQPLTKVLVIGLDAGDPALMDQWIAEGLLPNLGRLRKMSSWGAVTNPLALESGTVWPTFHTSKSPGNYIQHDALRYFDPYTYEFSHMTYDDLPPDYLWQRLSREGKRCCVLDSPYVPLDPNINGTMIVDWGLHVPSQGYGIAELKSWPLDAKDEVLDLVGPDPFGGVMCDDQKLVSPDDYRHFVERHLDRIRKKSKITRHFLSKGHWDFFETVFCDLHCVGHHTWHIADRSHPKYDPRFEEKVGYPYQQAFIETDRAIGEILSMVDDRTLTFLYASHGMGPQRTATGLLDRILAILDDDDTGLRSDDIKFRLKSLWQKTPPEVRAFLKPLKRPFDGALTPETLLGNRRERRFFEVYNTQRTGGIRINLIGREANGLVTPDEFDGVLDHLIEELSKIKNAETDTPLVAEFFKTKDLYEGEYAERFPDLLVKWDDSHDIQSVSSERIGTLRQDYETLRTGDHTPTGMFAASGRGIVSAQLNRAVNAEDLGCSLLSVLGAPVSDCNGDVIPTIAGFRPEIMAAE